MGKKKKIEVEGLIITIEQVNDADYISLTDIAKNTERLPSESIRDWLRNTQTLLFLQTWESVHNKNFKIGQMPNFINLAIDNRKLISAKRYIEETGAIGIISKAGRYGGTYAHRDIAMHFCYWLSPEFAVYFVKEFQRLKQQEADLLGQSWNIQRLLTKSNFHIQTESVRQALPLMEWNTKKEAITQASELNMLNRIIFGYTAREWKKANPKLKGNIRDHANKLELVILNNLQAINSVLLEDGMSRKDRETKLLKIATSQMQILLNKEPVKKLDKI